MRWLRSLLLLLLFLLPPLAAAAPCCAEESQAETCCPLDRDCARPGADCRGATPVLTLSPTITPLPGALAVATAPVRPLDGARALDPGRSQMPPAARFTPLRN